MRHCLANQYAMEASVRKRAVVDMENNNNNKDKHNNNDNNTVLIMVRQWEETNGILTHSMPLKRLDKKRTGMLE